jgi:Do/DeqQ family serine protease
VSVALLALSTVAVGLAQAAPTPSDVGRSVAPLVDKVKNSVVTIQSTKIIRRAVREDPMTQYFRDRFGLGEGPVRRETQQSLGSGFIIDGKEGIVLTNNHVVAGADEVKVRLADDRSLDAKVEGSDPATDVAVIRIQHAPRDLRPVVLGDSDKVRVGDYVLAIGNPLGLGQTVTMGIVSAKNRALGGRLVNLEDFIQTDAAINQGNSGGPLFNFDGAVIGINSAILNPAMAMNVGFAIPINLARQIGEQLLTKHRVARGYLGVHTVDLTPDIARRLGIASRPGVVVNYVEPGSPAEHAGFRSNDVIIDMAGHPVDGSTRLQLALGAHRPGEVVKVGVLRGGRKMDVDVKLTENVELSGAEVLGVRVLPVSPDESQELGVPALKVTSVNPRGPASGSLQEGDLIVAVMIGQRQAPATAAALQQLQERVGRGGWGRLVIVRDGNQLVITVG